MIIITGSKSLYIRNLIHRKCNDIDLIYNENLIPIRKYLRKYNIYLDFSTRHDFPIEYDLIKYKNRNIKVISLHLEIYYKYKYYKHGKSIDFNNKNTQKHYKDLINVFHNLGKQKSLIEINKINLLKEDIDELIKLMEIGINNKQEIL